MALKKIRVIEMAGLAPAPFCGKILAEHGADVIRLDRIVHNPFQIDLLASGKRSFALNLKSDAGRGIFLHMMPNVDVLIDPFRPGVMEKIGLGAEQLTGKFPKLVYARLNGFGTRGQWRDKAGHDINFLALSGVLSRIGRSGQNPYAPLNIVADFGGGGLLCAFGILLALFERFESGQGQVVDCNMVHGSAYLSSLLFLARDKEGISNQSRGENILDGGCPFYDTYETIDGCYMSVGALEPQFFSSLVEILGLEQYRSQQYSRQSWDKMRRDFSRVFKSKSRAEWTELFSNVDACVSPVLEMEESLEHESNIQNEVFVESAECIQPNVAPSLSRSPGWVNRRSLREIPIGKHTVEVLSELGFSSETIADLEDKNVIFCNKYGSKL